MKTYKTLVYTLIILTNLLSVPAMAATKPSEIFPGGNTDKIQLDGVDVRKGTVTAFILNLKALEKNIMSHSDPKEIASLITLIREAIVPLKALKMFEEIIPIEDLLNAKRSNGEIHQSKVLVAGLYLQQFPKEMTPALQNKIKSLIPSLQSAIK